MKQFIASVLIVIFSIQARNEKYDRAALLETILSFCVYTLDM